MNSCGRIGAFFDIDGTLLAAPSLEWRFLSYLLACDLIHRKQFACWASHFAKTILRDPHAAIHANKFYLTGLSESLAINWEKSLVPDSATDVVARASLPFFADGIERIAWHLSQGHRIFFVTGTIEPLANIFVRIFGRILVRQGLAFSAEVRATPLETCAGAFTGRIAGQHMSGREKATALRALALLHRLSFSESYAYGNSRADVPMLEAVGHPVAVNPQRQLMRIARCRGWNVRSWRSMRLAATSPATVPPTIAAMSDITRATKSLTYPAEETR